MQEAFQEVLWGLMCCVCPLCILVIVAAVIGMVMFIRAAVAVLNYNALECDEPLKWYLLVSLLWSQVPRHLVGCMQESLDLDAFGTAIASLVASVPGYGVLVWGIYMVSTAETCQSTNPGLFYPTRDFIVVQGAFVVLGWLFFLVSFMGIWHVLRILNSLKLLPGEGCKQAVQALPQIPHSSQELIDLEDGHVLDCPICRDPLTGQDKAAVKTPCGHYFHQECLATWCTSHLDCPLCRQQVGPPDGPDK